MSEKLQKIMSRAGVGSRRHSEEMIKAGRVTINGKVAKLGERADAGQDKIAVDGKEVTDTQLPNGLGYNEHKSLLQLFEYRPDVPRFGSCSKHSNSSKSVPCAVALILFRVLIVWMSLAASSTIHWTSCGDIVPKAHKYITAETNLLFLPSTPVAS